MKSTRTAGDDEIATHMTPETTIYTRTNVPNPLSPFDREETAGSNAGKMSAS